MKIAIDVTPILPAGECGGVKQLIMELLKGFGERAKSDNFILLTAFYNHEIFREYEKFGMQRICVRKDNQAANRSLWKSFVRRAKMKLDFYFQRGFLREKGVLVLFCPMAAPIYCEPGIPTVSIICDLQHMYYPSFFPAAELAHRNNFYNQLKRNVDYVISISDYTKATVIEKLSIPVERVFSIPICIQNRLTVPSPDLIASTLRKYNLEGRKYCIYPANLWHHKNHRMLFVAFNMFTKQYPDYNLHLVLTGAKIENNKILDHAINQMGLAERIHFLGYLPEEELTVIWHNSHFLVFPSLFEGFGIPLVEAMIYNKPIIASNVTSIPEVAGDAAYYFNPSNPDEIVNALYRIMQDKYLYDSLIEKGRERLERYDFDKMVDSYISVLHTAALGGHTVNWLTTQK